MPQVDLVVIGASAGGLPALITIVSALPPDFPAAVLIVVHTGKTGDSYLPQILANKGRVPVLFAAHGAAIRTGCVYVAPPDSHLVVLRGGQTLARAWPSRKWLSAGHRSLVPQRGA